MAKGPLPKHLQEDWGNRTKDPRDLANFCYRQSLKTPAIPVHNGLTRCLACGEPGPLASYRKGLRR